MLKFRLPLSMLLVTFVLIYVAFCPAINPWLIDRLVFHPFQGVDVQRMENIAGYRGESVEFAGDLSGWLYKVPNAKYVVLFTHGNAGNVMHRTGKIESILACKNSVFIWDYHGFGVSGGTAGLNGVASDVVAAYDYLISRGYKPEQIVLYGESLGCGVNAELALQRKIRAAVLDSGFTSLIDIGQQRIMIFRLYPDPLLPKVVMDVRKGYVHTPTLIIHGVQDENIPLHHAEAVHKALPNSRLVVLPNTSHNYVAPADQATAHEAICRFLSELPTAPP